MAAQVMRGAHPRPVERAMIDCPGECVCRKAGRFSRETCELQYQAAIQAIIADIRKDDPQ